MPHTSDVENTVEQQQDEIITSVKLPRDLWQRVRAVGARRDTSGNEVVVFALNQLIDELEQTYIPKAAA